MAAIMPFFAVSALYHVDETNQHQHGVFTVSQLSKKFQVCAFNPWFNDPRSVEVVCNKENMETKVVFIYATSNWHGQKEVIVGVIKNYPVLPLNKWAIDDFRDYVDQGRRYGGQLFVATGQATHGDVADRYLNIVRLLQNITDAQSIEKIRVNDGPHRLIARLDKGEKLVSVQCDDLAATSKRSSN